MDVQSSFFRDTWVEIDLDGIEANVAAVRRRLPKDVAIIAVVKANAYGHGDVEVAVAALNAGASMLAVAFLDEALSLRQKGLTVPILVLGASRAEDVNFAAENEITLTVFDPKWIEKAQAILRPELRLSVHVKVDTGMGRIGIRTKEELGQVEAMIQDDSRLQFDGIYTHFATADELEEAYFRKQLQSFEELINSLRTRPRCIHSGNSATALRYGEALYDAVRLGIVMYGLTPSQEIKPTLPIELKEAFSLHSRITQVKKIHAGDKLSYGGTYEAEGEEWIATIPIGYADGWIRGLQGQEVLVNGERSPIVGRICMDQCMIRLPLEVEVGEQVTLIGKQQTEVVSIDEIATKLNTINYEIPCMIASRIPRIYKKNGEIMSVRNALFSKNN